MDYLAHSVDVQAQSHNGEIPPEISVSAVQLVNTGTVRATITVTYYTCSHSKNIFVQTTLKADYGNGLVAFANNTMTPTDLEFVEADFNGGITATKTVDWDSTVNDAIGHDFRGALWVEANVEYWSGSSGYLYPESTEYPDPINDSCVIDLNNLYRISDRSPKLYIATVENAYLEWQVTHTQVTTHQPTMFFVRDVSVNGIIIPSLTCNSATDTDQFKISSNGSDWNAWPETFKIPAGSYVRCYFDLPTGTSGRVEIEAKVQPYDVYPDQLVTQTWNVPSGQDGMWYYLSCPVNAVPQYPVDQFMDDINPFSGYNDIYFWVNGAWAYSDDLNAGDPFKIYIRDGVTKIDVVGYLQAEPKVFTITTTGWQLVGNPFNRTLNVSDVTIDPPNGAYGFGDYAETGYINYWNHDEAVWEQAHEIAPWGAANVYIMATTVFTMNPPS